jgi:hypothetical protein
MFFWYFRYIFELLFAVDMSVYCSVASNAPLTPLMVSL